MPDEHIYGTSRSNMRHLLDGIGGDGDVEFPQRPARGGGGKSIRLVRFTTNGALASGTCSADFIEMDATTIGTDTLRDPTGIHSTLTTGVTGLAIYQDSKYYVINANCP